MNTHISSVLNRVTADEQLKENTIKFLQNALTEKRFDQLVTFNRRGVSPVKKLVFAVCSIAFVLFTSVIGYAVYKTPVAYICLDINPSVEIGINTFDRVVSAEGYNEDGKTILKDCKFKNLTIKGAVAQIVEAASEKGFIADDGSTVISITAETNNSSLAEKLEIQAELGANEAISKENDVVTIHKDNISLDIRDEAKKLSITPGKLKLIQKLQSLDSTITVEQYKDSKVTEIMSEIKELSKKDDTKKSADPKEKEEKSTTNENSNSQTSSNNRNNKNEDSSTVKNSNGSSKNSVVATSKPKNNKGTNDNKKKDDAISEDEGTIPSPTATPKPNKVDSEKKNKKE